MSSDSSSDDVVSPHESEDSNGSNPQVDEAGAPNDANVMREMLNGTWELRMVYETHSAVLRGTHEQLTKMNGRMQVMTMDMSVLRNEVIMRNVVHKLEVEELLKKITDAFTQLRERDETIKNRMDNIENQLNELNGH